MKLCGANESFQLGEESAKVVAGGVPIVTPVDSHLDISTLLSISLYNHSVFITKENEAFAYGYDANGQIYGPPVFGQPRQIIKKEQKIEILDPKGNKCKFISAVTGYPYTLYLVTSESDHSNQLVYVHFQHQSNIPLFLNLDGRRPIYLFGGYETAVAVDEEGLIFIITPSVLLSPADKLIGAFLPNDEMPVNFACCFSYVIALSSNGNIYEASLEPIQTQRNSKPRFEIVKDLEGDEIIDISGSYDHCFVILKDGRVFGRGSNSHGRLGLSQEKINEKRFHEISSLKKYKIVSAFAGSTHSLFITSEGKVLACGSNCRGEAFLDIEPSFNWIYEPVETIIKGGCSFCIAGLQCSAAFIESQPPINSPNQKIKVEKKKKQSIEELIEENRRLKEENDAKQKEIERLQQKIDSNHHQRSSKQIDILDSEKIDGLDKIEEIGSGNSCKVYKVSDKVIFALKEMNISDSTFDDFRHLMEEYEIINMVHHPNIIQTFGFFLSDEKHPPSILLEYCEENLEQAIMKKMLTNVQVVFYIYQILEGMKFLHSHKIMHRDLKPSSILIKSNKTIKIGGFGTAKLMSFDEISMKIDLKAQKFIAVEILNEKEYNEKVDVYSFGVLLIFILNHGDVSAVKVNDILKGIKPKINGDFTPLALKIIEDCLDFDPKNRPSFQDILKYMEENDFQIMALNEGELKEVRFLINNHKEKI